MKRRKTDAPLERFKKDSCLRPFHGGFHRDFTGDHAALRAIDGAAQSLGRMGGIGPIQGNPERFMRFGKE